MVRSAQGKRRGGGDKRKGVKKHHCERFRPSGEEKGGGGKGRELQKKVSRPVDLPGRGWKKTNTEGGVGE